MRRRMMLGRKSELPAGYRRCEYLESTGTQWIDTGIYPTPNTAISVRYSTELDGIVAVFGSIIGNNCSFMVYPRGSEGGIGYCYGTTEWETKNDRINYNIGCHTIYLSKGGVKIDDKSIVDFSDKVFITKTDNYIHIFKRNGKDDCYAQKIYSVILKESDFAV